MYSDILVLVRTTFEREILLGELMALKDSLFEPKKGPENILKDEVRVSVANIIRSKLEKGEKLESYIDGLVRTLDGLTEVKFELPKEPTEREIGLIYDWLTTNVPSGAIIAYSINPSVLGGATISHKGRYYDGSLRTILESTLKEVYSSYA
ncbi:hypothetical protein A2803_00880 [Candidatus Woesebacteria bacterium RIFCSPHIGHO2_01_FULL_44_21]|uniref:ATP synthase subunit delta n=1 Tax=Candidatus Woesebacteria bacterium RIFCSPHIGHO2_01_FULL_44_21 TaxID=1802503 RepID=A0A1F7YY56_9BACT|nr:MAG: hypothetical protein A2803_00880 [Candidatus Woesebacteria bacterium RIFCSPHIGHO2_01_FULL_44_21]OGM70988.1 MAG: hypothetical protein A2897_00390 [Candidatus Woesebacteria bacterium RIFCSPLOWO2_01_FULL_44_24b]